MKRMHRPDLFSWSTYSEKLDIDFNGFLWTREGGNVLIDPLPMTPHDRAHFDKLGGAKFAVITNSFHARATADFAGVQVLGPAAEREAMPLRCDRWLKDGDEPFPGMRVFELHGSKTPGELALLLGETLICGDLIRSHRGGSLMLLRPEQGLKDPAAAAASVRRMAALPVEAVLVGDGFHAFREGRAMLRELSAQLDARG